jgi:hypothetical protein
MLRVAVVAADVEVGVGVGAGAGAGVVVVAREGGSLAAKIHQTARKINALALACPLSLAPCIYV